MADPEMDFEDIVGPRHPRGATSARNTVRGGSRRGFSYQLVWPPEARGAHGSLTIKVAGFPIWGDEEQGISGDWTHLLRFLAKRWNELLLAQSYPEGLTPMWPSGLRAALAGVLPALDFLEIEASFAQFSQAHNLARCWSKHSRGKHALPDLWVLREGNYMILDAPPVRCRWSFSDVVRSLASLGDAIARRLTTLHVHPDAVRAWESREGISEEEAQIISLGLPPRHTRYLLGSGVLTRQSRSELFRDFNEVTAAARMMARCADLEDLRAVANEISGLEANSVPQLDEMSQVAFDALSERHDLDRPWSEGQFLAEWLRKRLNVWTPGAAVHPEQLLSEWDVPVRKVTLNPAIEAVSVWGSRHGPAILLNEQGLHNRSLTRQDDLSGGVRATLAHEICHLLIDRGRSLPVVEVLGGSTPLRVEQRANAFAAEFLLPRAWAMREYRSAANMNDALDQICERYRVTKMLAARQILNYSQEFGEMLPDDDRSILEFAIGRWD